MEQTTPVSEKDKLKQGFGSFDALTVVVSIIFVFGFVINIISSKNEQHKVELAKELAKNYAGQLVLKSIGEAVNNSKDSERGPASVSEESTFYAGKLGKDPWGHPYQYKVIQNSYGQPVYMVVISPGPDGNLDTNLDESMIEAKKTTQLHTKGDDIGYLKSFR